MNFWSKFPVKELLCEIGSAENEKILADVNAHVHTPFSFSAFQSIDQALKMAREEKVNVLGINDFYTTLGYEEWAEKCIKHKIFPLFNIEFVGLSPEEQEKGIRINDPNNPGRIYISGKGLAFPACLDEPYFSQLESIKISANRQVKEMCQALNNHFRRVKVDIRLSYNEIVEKYTMGMIRERHLAKALRVKVFEKTKEKTARLGILVKIFSHQAPFSDIDDKDSLENEIRARLLKAGGPAFIPEKPEQFLGLKDICQVILKAGGIPTYPLLADSVNGGYTEFEKSKEELLKTMKAKGIYSVEFITNRNSTKSLEEYAAFFVENNIIVTFGSEHNTPGLFPLKLVTKNGEELSDKLKEINFDGACMVAAHQYLTARYGLGCLNEKGTIRADKTDEFKKIGKGLLKYYYSN